MSDLGCVQKALLDHVACTMQEREGRSLTLAEAVGQLGWADAQELGRCLEQGQAARYTLYHRNIGLVFQQAMGLYKCFGKAVPYEDLFQVWGSLDTQL